MRFKPYSFALAFTFLISNTCFASIRASTDRREVPLDESVTLRVIGTGQEPLQVTFDAPDFEILNQFESSQFQAVYVNGKFENKSERSITFILRPLKVGSLRIQNIRSGTERAPDLSVQVVQDTSQGQSLPGDAPKLNADQRNFFVRAEVNKSRAYKGEQMIVSYYLYRRTKASVRDVMQYPSFDGFIREDMEMPILSNRPDYERVSLGGIPFERTLLARYALYPIREGSLKIDSMNIRADYIPRNQSQDDLMEDPFFQFFTQVTPRTGTSKSDPITVEVLQLPNEGKSELFSGGVGQFEVSAKVETTAIKAYSPLTVLVTVKGKGNVSLIEFPTVAWPKSIKPFETQGKTKNLGQGMSEKTFEVVIVPQEAGSLTIPSIEFEFFNPESRTYSRKKTETIQIQVEPGTPPSQSEADEPVTAGAAAATGAEKAESGKATYGELRLAPTRPGDSSVGMLGQPWWRWVAWTGLAIFLWFIGLVIWDETQKRSRLRMELIRRRKGVEDFWQELAQETQNLVQKQSEPQSFAPIMEKLVQQIYLSLDEAYQISSRALPQRELAKVLTEEKGLNAEHWKSLSQIFHFYEAVRFGGSSGVITHEDVRHKTPEMIQIAQKLCAEISTQ